MAPATVRAIEVTPLSVPLREPFVIATGRMDVTRAVLVRAVLDDAKGRASFGLGEAAALPPVTTEDQPQLLSMIAAAAPALVGVRLQRLNDVTAAVARADGQRRGTRRRGNPSSTRGRG